MCKINKAYADHIVGMREFKANPADAVKGDGTVLVLAHNKPVMYCINKDEYEFVYEAIKARESTLLKSSSNTRLKKQTSKNHKRLLIITNNF